MLNINGAFHSDTHADRKRFNSSDSEEEEPKRPKIDSDEDEEKEGEEEKAAKRKAAVLSDSDDEEKACKELFWAVYPWLYLLSKLLNYEALFLFLQCYRLCSLIQLDITRTLVFIGKS